MSKLSYVNGTGDTPLIYQTIGRMLDGAVSRWSEREALVVKHQDIRWNYQEFLHQVEDCAAGMLALGLGPGDRVGVWAPNCAEWIVAQFATAMSGLIQVTINPAYGLVELEYALNKVGCKALITAPQFRSSNYLEMIRELVPEIDHATPGALQAQRLPQLKTVIRLGSDKTPGYLNFHELTAMVTDQHRDRLKQCADMLQPDDPINIQFTSGTTGSPKGATLSHFNILNNGFFVGEAMRFTENDRLCVPVPLYHCFGMVMANLNCIAHGATLIYPSEGFEPELTLKAIEEEKCTALFGVPTMFIAQLDHPNFDNYDLSSLRTGIMAGASCPIEVMKQVVNKMHMPEVTIAYGMTETSPVSFQSSVEDPIELRVSTVGRVHPHTEVKVVDENDHCVVRGQHGELCTRGYSVMQGYWADEEKTNEAIDTAGWMHTGDLAAIDAQGYCNIVGRVKDMVIRGGENVYPREVEDFLFTHSKIQNVAVFGVPDKKYGEELCAWIKLKENETMEQNEINEYCQGMIAHFKIPHYIYFVDDFPMTVTGKIQKYIMREQIMEELQLEEQQTA